MDQSLEKYLMYPIYLLNRRSDSSLLGGLTPQDLILFSREFSPQVHQGVLEALEWVIENPDRDFSSLVPGIRFLNSQIHSFLVTLLAQLENSEGSPE